ncbi:hypothetical protein [Nitrosomonas cryotolerans]|uniref:hypothetical protein n=1 Tax=Nitrosomonas cryotolerans TaxID=44575 RepID=UPI001FEA1D4E|nr:hypothetical protein [Nitrosomonas cryotolerans]
MRLNANRTYRFSKAGTASPAAKTLRAALMSQSWMDPHSGQVHSRTFKGILFTVCLHPEQHLLLGYHVQYPQALARRKNGEVR